MKSLKIILKKMISCTVHQSVCCQQGNEFQNEFSRPITVSSLQALKTGGCWFDPRLGKYSYGGVISVVATGFIPLSLLFRVLTMVVWESSHLCRELVKKNSRKAQIGALAIMM